MVDRQKAYQTGLEAEEMAARFLRSLGLEEVDRRARMAGGEIDLIVEDAETLVFVEVKARKTITEGAEALNLRQQERIRAGMRTWLAQNDPDGALMLSKTIRCDVVLVAPGCDPLHIPNAFPAADESGL